MTKLSHIALLDEIAAAIKRPTPDNRTDRELGADLLSLIAARLSDVTPEMVEAYERNYDNSIGEAENVCVSDWRAMLAASCLGETKP